MLSSLTIKAITLHKLTARAHKRPTILTTSLAIKALMGLCLLSLALPVAAADVSVYAAASLTNALNDIAARYQSSHKDRIKSVFAASSTLAKQIEAGAPAEIFASADTQWMDYLDQRKLVVTSSRTNLLSNTLVLIAPTSAPRSLSIVKDQPPTFDGRLCIGEPNSVPAGIYAKQALISLGWWPALSARIVATDDVRGTLAFVERAECPLGIVYETDTKISQKVMIVARFPADTHAPITYPFALIANASNAARGYFIYLMGDDAQRIFRRHGFKIINPEAMKP